jgi:tRNA nucleotidyltransferase/poly(A) polymerase
MSDYMFLLESHLTGEQFRAVGQIRAAAGRAGLSLFLTGAAIRDVFAGFPARSLTFTTEGNSTKLAKALAKSGAVQVGGDGRRKSIVLRFPGGVTAEIGMAHTQRFAKAGQPPQIAPSTIHEDLQCRDFTINAIALSLNKASLGLIIDPANGMGDIERKELRTIGNYSFYDEPARMVRLIRLKVRMGYQVDERTRMQMENAREAGMLERITPEALGAELRDMATETNVHDLVKALEEEKLLELYSPALAAGKVNYASLQKLQKMLQMVPFGFEFELHPLPLFLEVLMERLNAKERAALIKAAQLTRAEAGAVDKLAGAAKKLERSLTSAKLQKASALYQVLSKAPGEQVLHLAVYSGQRIVQDRIKNYFTKHIPAAMEITNEMVVATGAALGTPKFERVKEEMILTRLDARPKKVPPPEPPPPPPMSGFARGAGLRRAQG